VTTTANSGQPKTSKAQVQQVRTISKQRIAGGRVGHGQSGTMQAVDAALKLHLDLR
jgi:mRNA-degrading endonuclease toxin of MazEF toxin-antitoxin module